MRRDSWEYRARHDKRFRALRPMLAFASAEAISGRFGIGQTRVDMLARRLGIARPKPVHDPLSAFPWFEDVRA